MNAILIYLLTAQMLPRAEHFIIRYGSDRSRLPLCAIAAMHNDTFLYSNETYRAFCCLPREIQNRVLEHSCAGIKITDVEDLEQQAINCLLEFYGNSFPNNRTPFYDNAKYVTRSIERYSEVKYEHVIEIDANEESPLWLRHNSRLYCDNIIDALDAVLETHSIPENHVIDELMERYSFHNSNQAKACQFATALAYWLMVYSKDAPRKQNSMGIGEALTSDDPALEDLFLAFLYAYYVRYVE